MFKRLFALTLLALCSCGQPVQDSGPRYFTELSTAPDALTSTGVVYTKTDKSLYFKNSDGLEMALGVSAGTYLPYEEETDKREPAGPNLYLNNDFETWAALEAPVGYDYEMGGGGEESALFPTKSTDSHSGTYAVQFNSAYQEGATPSYIYTVSPAISSSNYTWKGYVKGSGAFFLYLAYSNEWDAMVGYAWTGDEAGTWVPLNAQLLENNLFEDGFVLGVPVDWLSVSTGGTAATSQETTIVHSGTSAVKFTNDGANYVALYQALTGLESGHEYRLRGFFRTSEGVNWAQIKMYALNGAGDKIYNFNSSEWDNYAGGAPTAQQYTYLDGVDGDRYELNEFNEVPAYTDGTLTLYVYSDNSNGIWYMDDAWLADDEDQGPSEDFTYIFTPSASYSLFTSPSFPTPDSDYIITVVGASGDVVLDDVYMGVNGTGANLMTNVSFETWMDISRDAKPTDWNEDFIEEFGNVYITTDKHAGNYAASFVSGFGDEEFSILASPAVTASEGEEYVVKFWGKDVVGAQIGVGAMYNDIWDQIIYWAFSGPNVGTWVSPAYYTTDASLEDWTGPTLDSWTVGSTGGGSATVVQNSGTVHTGTYAATLTSDGSGNRAYISQSITGLPAQRVAVAAYTIAGTATNVSVYILNQAQTHIYNFNTQGWNVFDGTPDSNQMSGDDVDSNWALNDWGFLPYTDGSATFFLLSDSVAGASLVIDDIQIIAEGGDGPDEESFDLFTLTGTYTEYTGTAITAPDHAFSVVFVSQNNTSAIDDVTLTLEGGGSNLITHGDFESWESTPAYYFPTSWNVYERFRGDEGETDYSSELSYSTEHHSGVSSAKLESSTNEFVLTGQLVSATAGEDYGVSVWAKGASGGEYSQISIYNANPLVVGTESTQVWDFVHEDWDDYSSFGADHKLLTLLTTSWAEISGTIEAPDSGEMFVSLGTQDGTASTIYYDTADVHKLGGLESSIDIYNMTNVSNLSDLTDDDTVFSLEFTGDSKYAFELDGTGIWSTDFTNWKFLFDLVFEPTDEASSGAQDKNSHTIVFYPSMWDTGTSAAVSHQWNVRAYGEGGNPVSSYFGIGRDSDVYLGIDSDGKTTVRDLEIEDNVEFSGSVSHSNRTDVDDADYLVTGDEYRISYTDLSASRTVTLPDSLLGTGFEVRIKDEGGDATTHSIVVDPEGGTLIDGAASYLININYGSITVYATATGWGIE